MKTIISTEPERVERAAEQIRSLIENKPDAVLALSAEDACLPIYEKLGELCKAGKLSLSKAHIYPAAEFAGVEPGNEKSCRVRLSSALKSSDLDPKAISVLAEERLDSYDDEIREAGGLDLAVLGLGDNARIGFNEPATPYDSRTHRQKLAPASRRELAPLFGEEERVPEFGLTMGIKTIVEAREILVTASGEKKAKAVFNMLYGRDDSTVPAAFLQLPLEVTVYLDEAAAAKL